jgi:hypothetical protein
MLPREELFFRILIFFALFTAVTGGLNLASSGTFTIKDMSMIVSGGPSGSIPGQISVQPGSGFGSYQEGANTAEGAIITDMDFTTLPTINQNVVSLFGGTWTLTNGRGLVLTSLPFFTGLWEPSVVSLRNAMSVGNIYTMNVKVDNSISGGDFYVYPRHVSGYSGSDLKVVFSSDGVHIKKFPLYFGVADNGDDYFYPLPSAQNTIPGGSTITTVLTEVVSTQSSNVPDYTAHLTVSKDGTTLFTDQTVRSVMPGTSINDYLRHGAAGSDSLNFAVMGFSSIQARDNSSLITSPGTTPTTGTPESLILAGINAIWQFLGLIGPILGLSNQSIVPFWLWAIVGLPCIATLILIYIEIARGV